MALKAIWAVSVVFGIALMLGFTPVQSIAVSPACDKILDLVAAGKIPVKAAAKILEKLDCDEKVVIITVINGGNPAPDASCKNILGSEQGIADANGEVVLIVPATLTKITVGCSVPDFPVPQSGLKCDVPLTGAITNIEVIIGVGGGCVL